MLHNYEQITTLEQAFEYVGRRRELDLSAIPEDLHDIFRAFYDMIVVTEALNDKWTPDKNKNTTMDEKYIMIADMYFDLMEYHGLHVSKSLVDISHSKVFALRTLGTTKHFGKYFLDVYKKFLLTPIKRHEVSSK